jgi:large conductance mechanosensitive channel
MGVIKEFREFAVKGNVVDMAIGIIIGASFGKIVSSLVADIITPPLGLILGGVDFKGLQVTLQEASGTAAAVTLNYGVFIQAMVDFLIIAFSMFMVVKGMNALKRKQEQTPQEAPKPPAQELLLSEIRDILRKNREELRKAV